MDALAPEALMQLLAQLTAPLKLYSVLLIHLFVLSWMGSTSFPTSVEESVPKEEGIKKKEEIKKAVMKDKATKKGVKDQELKLELDGGPKHKMKGPDILEEKWDQIHQEDLDCNTSVVKSDNISVPTFIWRGHLKRILHENSLACLGGIKSGTGSGL